MLFNQINIGVRNEGVLAVEDNNLQAGKVKVKLKLQCLASSSGIAEVAKR